MKRYFSILMLSTATFAASPAIAATLYQFELTGAAQASFQLPAEPIPTGTRALGFGSDSFYLQNVQVTYNGESKLAELEFFSDLDWWGGFGLNVDGGSAEVSTTSAWLFSGPSSDPVFRTGTFNLVGYFNSTQTYSLTISEVVAGPIPEPATWALMIMGFGLVGAAMRHKQRNGRAAVAYA